MLEVPGAGLNKAARAGGIGAERGRAGDTPRKSARLAMEISPLFHPGLARGASRDWGCPVGIVISLWLLAGAVGFGLFLVVIGEEVGDGDYR